MLLSQTQKRVMAGVGNGETARSQSEDMIAIRGTTVCKLDTMLTLESLGLVEKDSDGNWIATDSGKAVAAQFRL